MAIGTIPPVYGEPALTVGTLGGGGLRQGQIIEARVLERVSTEILRLATASGRLDVVLPKSGLSALPQPGSIVHLQVGHAASAGTPILQFVDGPARGLTVTVRPAETLRPAAAAPVVPPAAPQAAPGDPVVAALDAAVSRALKVQTGSASLYAAATALMAAPAGTVPREVQVALQRLLGLRLGDGRAVTGEDVRTAVRGSGLFHERDAAGAKAAASDVKAIFAGLRTAVERWLATPAAPAAAASAGTGEPAIAGPADADSGAARPAPPHRGAPVEGQPARTLPPPVDGAAARTLAGRLLEDADRFGARIVLHQAASLETDRADIRAGRDAAAHWSLEVPVAGPSGTSIADIRIERDQYRPATEEEPGGRTWRVQIGFAVDPLGPMTARVALLSDRRVAVALWCEDAAAIEALDAGIAELRAGLEAAGLQVAVVDVRIGRPPDPAASSPALAAYHRIDRSL